jgi:hypothetical protein
MTATISPEIVQLALGFGNLRSAQWLAIRGLSGQAITEDIKMFARKGVFSSIGRASAAATIVAVALTAYQPSMAFAGSAPAKGDVKGMTATAGTSTATDFSSRGRRYGGGGGAAAAAAFAGIVGTGIAIAAAQNRRSYYDSYGYYDGGPTYGGPAYYTAPPAYYGGGPGYYGGGGYYRNSGVPHFRGHPIASW